MRERANRNIIIVVAAVESFSPEEWDFLEVQPVAAAGAVEGEEGVRERNRGREGRAQAWPKIVLDPTRDDAKKGCWIS